MKLLPIGTKTNYGTISAIFFISGERYYFMQKGNLTSMIPATVIQQQLSEIETSDNCESDYAKCTRDDGKQSECGAYKNGLCTNMVNQTCTIA